MGRRRKPLPLFEEVLIEDAGSEGKCVARIDGKVLFVTGAIPGDVCDVKVHKKKKSFMEGRAIKIHSYSDERTTPFCEYFGTCGGCKWQNMQYERQLHYKEKQVKDNLERLGGIPIPSIDPIVASKETKYYRNKLEYTFTNRRWLEEAEMNDEDKELNGVGFHVPGRFDRVLDVHHCHLQEDLSNQIRNEVRSYALQHSLSFFDLREQHGLLRNLIVRSTSTGEWMVILAVFENDEENTKALLSHLKSKFPQITSLQYVVNEKKNDSIADQDILLFNGRDHILEEMEGLKFKIGPKSFYQTNSQQAYELYKITREYADIQESDIVYDLYTGTGTIANFVARKAQKVVGIEYVPEAIEDAWENSRFNEIENTSFYAGDMKDVLTTDLIEKEGKPDIIITDPPRAGMHKNVIDRILEAEARRVVYVSCNPATQARDLELLSEKYEVKKVQPVDMFPHTHHVENVVSLELK